MSLQGFAAFAQVCRFAHRAPVDFMADSSPLVSLMSL